MVPIMMITLMLTYFTVLSGNPETLKMKRIAPTAAIAVMKPFIVLLIGLQQRSATGRCRRPGHRTTPRYREIDAGSMSRQPLEQQSAQSTSSIASDQSSCPGGDAQLLS